MRHSITPLLKAVRGCFLLGLRCFCVFVFVFAKKLLLLVPFFVFEDDNFIEKAAVFRRNELIDMRFAEEPHFELAVIFDLIEEGVHKAYLIYLKAEEFFHRGGRFVGDYVIDLAACVFEVLDSIFDLVIIGKLGFKPSVRFTADLKLFCLTAAEAEEFVALYRKHRSSFYMHKIARDAMDDAAAEVAFGVLCEEVEIFVAAVNEQREESLFADFFEYALLVLRAVPDKAKISADDEDIVLFQCFYSFIVKTAKVAVHISCYTDQWEFPPIN